MTSGSPGDQSSGGSPDPSHGSGSIIVTTKNVRINLVHSRKNIREEIWYSRGSVICLIVASITPISPAQPSGYNKTKAEYRSHSRRGIRFLIS